MEAQFWVTFPKTNLKLNKVQALGKVLQHLFVKD